MGFHECLRLFLSGFHLAKNTYFLISFPSSCSHRHTWPFHGFQSDPIWPIMFLLLIISWLAFQTPPWFWSISFLFTHYPLEVFMRSSSFVQARLRRDCSDFSIYILLVEAVCASPPSFRPCCMQWLWESYICVCMFAVWSIFFNVIWYLECSSRYHAIYPSEQILIEMFQWHY